MVLAVDVFTTMRSVGKMYPVYFFTSEAVGLKDVMKFNLNT